MPRTLKRLSKLLLLPLALIFVLGATGEKETDEAKKHLEEVIAAIDYSARHTRTYCAYFKQCEYDKHDEQGEETYGRFYLERERYSSDEADEERLYFRMRFEYYAPKASVTILDGAQLFTMEQGRKGYKTLVVNNSKMEVVFAGFMTIKYLLENYSITIAEENAKEIALDLTPESALARDLFLSVRLTFDKATYLPTSISQNRLNGTRNLFLLQKAQKNSIFGTTTFDPGHMADFVKKHYVKPPPMVAVTNITPVVVTNNVPCVITNKLLTAQGEKLDICHGLHSQIKAVVITNIVKTEVKKPKEKILPL